MKAYKKVSIYYFSGTGNAYNVAVWVKDIAFKKNIESEIFDITKIKNSPIPLLLPETLIIFISPIHGFNYPPIMINFILNFQKGNNDVILMNTRAGMLFYKTLIPGLTGVAFYFSWIILKIKGYSIKGMIPISMPSNWIFIHPCLNNNTVAFIYQKMKFVVEKYANKFLEGEIVFPALFEIIQDVIITPVSLGYYFIGRFILSKTFFASSNCNNCKICEKECPLKAIEFVNKRPFWTLKCENCMRCINNCPQIAIQAAHGFILFVLLLFNLFFIVFINYVLKDFFQIYNFNIHNCFLQLFLFFMFLLICYRGMHFMLRFIWFEKLMNLTSLTFYKFWGGRYDARKTLFIK